jgi:hypothetical protein
VIIRSSLFGDMRTCPRYGNSSESDRPKAAPACYPQRIDLRPQTPFASSTDSPVPNVIAWIAGCAAAVDNKCRPSFGEYLSVFARITGCCAGLGYSELQNTYSTRYSHQAASSTPEQSLTYAIVIGAFVVGLGSSYLAFAPNSWTT